jgi:hypothetical protein
MKKLIFIYALALFLPHLAQAQELDLPMGGKITLDSTEWKVVDGTAVNSPSLLLFHKKNQGLRGVIMDGSIRDKSVCAGETTTRVWKVCRNGNQAITFQRSLGKAFQTYVITFAGKEDTHKKVAVDKFVAQLEKAR